MNAHELIDLRTRYTIVRPLASGGMGAVYLALKHGVSDTRTRVVLKTTLGPAAESRRWLAREAQLGMEVASPRIVEHRAFFEAEGRAWLELQYIDGVDLAELYARGVRAGQRMPAFVAVYVMVELMDALTCLEHASIVHRDITPRNVMLRARPAGVTLLDFGVARRVGVADDALFGRRVVGKLAYMAPEQYLGELIEPSADVYAASVVLWSMLTGRLLFGVGTKQEVMARVLSDERPPPSRYARGVPRALDAVVLAGVARRRRDRPASAEDLRAVLLELMPGLLPAGAGADPRAAVGRWMRAVEPRGEVGGGR